MTTRKTQTRAAAIRTARLQAERAELVAKRAAKNAAEAQLDLESAFADAREAQRRAAILSAEEADRQNRPFLAGLAQGDSWFNYSICGRSIITDLEGMLRGNGAFYNLAQPGRLLRDMMIGQLRKDFETALSRGLDEKHPWNVVLLSGGGNDICGNGTFVDWLKNFDGGELPEAYITPAFDEELRRLSDLYDDAATLVAARAPGARLFVHGYDFAIPDGRCVQVVDHCFAGPWMRPAFDVRGFHKGNRQKVPTITIEIVKIILKRFRIMLDGVASRYEHLRVVPTQGTLSPRPASWANELHPTNPSFEKIAARFYDAIVG
jgi:hypothetical protein